MSDIDIPCQAAGCEEVRVWTDGEQEFFNKQGYEAPKYCKTHSAERRKQRNQREEKRKKMDENEQYGY